MTTLSKDFKIKLKKIDFFKNFITKKAKKKKIIYINLLFSRIFYFIHLLGKKNKIYSEITKKKIREAAAAFLVNYHKWLFSSIKFFKILSFSRLLIKKSRKLTLSIYERRVKYFKFSEFHGNKASKKYSKIKIKKIRLGLNIIKNTNKNNNKNEQLNLSKRVFAPSLGFFLKKKIIEKYSFRILMQFLVLKKSFALLKKKIMNFI